MRFSSLLCALSRRFCTDFTMMYKDFFSLRVAFIVAAILRRDPYEVEFIQSVQEVLHSLEPVLAKVPQ